MYQKCYALQTYPGLRFGSSGVWRSVAWLLALTFRSEVVLSSSRLKDSFTVHPTTQRRTSRAPESTAIIYCWSNDTASHPQNSWINSNLLLLIQRDSVTPPRTPESTTIFYCWSNETASPPPQNTWINSNLLLLIQRHSVTPPEHLNQQQSYTVDPTRQRHTPRTPESTAILYCWSNETASHPQNTWINSNLLLLI